jgi:outer membrane protein assembly factor BamB
MVGLGDRFDAEIDGCVTALASSSGNLFVGSSKGVVVRLETETGRQCARATFTGSITKLSVRGTVVTVSVANEQHRVKSTSLRTAK